MPNAFSVRFLVLAAALVAVAGGPASNRTAAQAQRPAAAAASPGKIAIVNGMLLDGYDVPPLHHAAVLVEGNRIVRIGRAAEIQIPPDYTVIDASGSTIMPGMMDLHAHLVLVGHGNYGEWFPWIDKMGRAATLPKVMEIAAKQLVEAGVTTAVDLGAPLKESLDIRDRVARGELPGPRLLVSGPWITRTPAVFPADYQTKVTTPEEAARETEALVKAGVDVIKAHSGLTREDYEAMVAVTRKTPVRIHAHTYAETDVRNALEAGIDVLQHAGSAGTPPYSQQLITDIVNSGRPVVVTGYHRSYLYPDTVAFPERLQLPQLKKDLPPDMYAEVQRSFRLFHQLPYFGTTDRQMLFGDQTMKTWIQSGAVLGMGTDSGTPANFNIDALWREMKMHVAMGMTPMRAIAAATRVNARIIGRGRDLGTIEPGKLADIIVVRGSPLQNIDALGDVEVVIKDGRIVKRTR